MTRPEPSEGSFRQTDTYWPWAKLMARTFAVDAERCPKCNCRMKPYEAWMPVDLYVGGSEHAVLHLLYARFWHKVLFDLGLVTHEEPFQKLVHQGTILGEDSQKMSKSRGNVINPDDVVKLNGADALRLYEMFMGPLEATKPWQTSGIEGVRRFLDRAFTVIGTGNVSADAPYDLETKRAVHKTIKKVTGDIEAMRFNTAISAMMVLVRQLGALEKVPMEAARAFTLLMSPFAPHLGEELWRRPSPRATAPWACGVAHPQEPPLGRAARHGALQLYGHAASGQS